jgi:hypothetical protein
VCANANDRGHGRPSDRGFDHVYAQERVSRGRGRDCDRGRDRGPCRGHGRGRGRGRACAISCRDCNLGAEVREVRQVEMAKRQVPLVPGASYPL